MAKQGSSTNRISRVRAEWRKTLTAWQHVESSVARFLEADKALAQSIFEAGDSLTREAKAEIKSDIAGLKRKRREAVKTISQLKGSLISKARRKTSVSEISMVPGP